MARSCREIVRDSGNKQGKLPSDPSPYHAQFGKSRRLSLPDMKCSSKNMGSYRPILAWQESDYLSIGISIPFSLPIFLAVEYPASACLTIPIPGSVVNTLSALSYASCV